MLRIMRKDWSRLVHGSTFQTCKSCRWVHVQGNHVCIFELACMTTNPREQVDS